MPRNTAWRGFAASPPMAKTSCLSHRKLRADTAVPIPHPAPHHQPRQATSTTAPAAPIAQISFQMRATARSIHNCSRAAASPSLVIARVPHQLADELHQPGSAAENHPCDSDPGGFEFPVQQVAEEVADYGRCGQHECQRGVFADHHRPRFFRHMYSLLPGALGRLFYQKTHLRVGRLHDGMDAEFLERFGGGGPDGTHLALAETSECGALNAEFAGHSRQVHYLDGGGEQRYLEGTLGKEARRLAQGFDIERQVPL